jgi:hypothetical protein
MSERKYGNWDTELMERALHAFRNCDMGLKAAARTYDVPKAMLKRRIDEKNKNATEHTQNFGRQCDLPKELEDELVRQFCLWKSLYLE